MIAIFGTAHEVPFAHHPDRPAAGLDHRHGADIPFEKKPRHETTGIVTVSFEFIIVLPALR